MFLMWVYDGRGYQTFSASSQPIVYDIEGVTYTDDVSAGDTRRNFMLESLPQIIGARYIIRQTPEERARDIDWVETDEILPTVTSIESNQRNAELRKNLDNVEGIQPSDLNQDDNVVEDALPPGHSATLLGVSASHPDWVLLIKENGRLGWTHSGLLDLTNVDIDELPQLSDNAINEFLGLE